MSQKSKTPSELIDARIEELGDWRGELLGRLRALVKEADPDVVEEWKWRGVPTWYHDGMICTGETYKEIVKMTFAKGASLDDPSGLFNSSLEGSTRRAIDFHEGEEIDEAGAEGSPPRRRGAERVRRPALNTEEPARAGSSTPSVASGPCLDFGGGTGEDRIEYDSRTAARDLAAVSALARRDAPDATGTTAPERPRHRPRSVS